MAEMTVRELMFELSNMDNFSFPINLESEEDLNKLQELWEEQINESIRGAMWQSPSGIGIGGEPKDGFMAASYELKAIGLVSAYTGYFFISHNRVYIMTDPESSIPFLAHTAKAFAEVVAKGFYPDESWKLCKLGRLTTTSDGDATLSYNGEKVDITGEGLPEYEEDEEEDA